MFFTALTVWWSDRLIKKPHSLNYFGLGLILGFGFISKYHMVLLVPILIIMLYFKKRLSFLWNWRIVLVIISGLIASSPVLWWNFKNDWISIRFQLEHGLGDKGFKLSTFLDYFAGQIFLIHPVFIPLILKKYRLIKDVNLRFWGAASAFVFLFFAYTSSKSHVEANWTTQAFPFLWAFVAVHLSAKWIRPVLVFWAVLSSFVLSLWVYPWFTHPALIKLNEVHRLQSLIEQTKELSPLYTSYHLLASSLSFYQKRQVYKLRGSSRFDYYDMLPESLPTADTFFFAAESEHLIPTHYLATYLVETYQKIGKNFVVYKATKL
jgi:hypothetical protein